MIKNVLFLGLVLTSCTPPKWSDQTEALTAEFVEMSLQSNPQLSTNPMGVEFLNYFAECLANSAVVSADLNKCPLDLKKEGMLSEQLAVCVESNDKLRDEIMAAAMKCMSE